MWLGRLLIGVARPSARGRKRRRVGPSSTVIEEMRISSPTRSWLFSAFAAAESISLWMSCAAPRGENASSARACSMCMPRTWSAMSRALRGATRTYLALARTTGTSSVSRRRRRLGAGFFASALAVFLRERFGAFLAAGFLADFSALASAFASAFSSAFASSLMSFSSAISQSVCLVPAAVRAEGAGRRELAELVPDHRLRDEDRNVFFAVVDGDRVADHLREDRGSTRPGFGHLFFAGLVLSVDASHQTLFDPGALFRRTPHQRPPFFLPRRRPRTM